jgi:hypothetical protein
MTTLTQAHRQWASRPADERFTSLTDMQAFAALSRQTSRSKVVSTREIELIPDDGDHKGLLIGARDGTQAAPTHWSFGQLCSLAATPSPASYFRESGLPTPIIADCLNYNLRFTRGVEDVKLLVSAKTARKPYDLAVTVALCYLATVPDPASHHVSSDGHGRDFLDGLAEARRALRRYANVIDIPMGILEDDRWCPPWPHLFTNQYDFRFCVDGKAYVRHLKTSASYCFPDHKEAAEFMLKNRGVLDATGFLDEKRRTSLKRQQNALLAQLVF